MRLRNNRTHTRDIGFVSVCCSRRGIVSLMNNNVSDNKTSAVTKIGRGNFDPTVYLVTDRRVAAGSTMEQIIESAIQGDVETNRPGVTFIQLREKNEELRESLKLGKYIREVTLQTRTAFVINDNVTLAKQLHADGVHIGQEDGSVCEARRILGEQAIVGVSAGTCEEALKAMEDGADYIGVGSIFATSSKPDAGHPIGSEGLKEIIDVVDGRIPVVAIGGIGLHNVEQCWHVGCDGVAVISAIMKSDHPGLDASCLHPK